MQSAIHTASIHTASVTSDPLRPVLPEPSEGSSATVGLPERFGPYRLIRRIGRGAQATVYEAALEAGTVESAKELPSGVERVALKRLEQRSPQAIQRLLHEAQVLRGFSSARVSRLLDQGWAEGIPYLVLEYVEGVTLETLLFRLHVRRQKVPTEVLLELLVQLGLALRVGHTWLDPALERPVPIAHGDLKPGNVLIGVDGQVRLTDFGSAQRTGLETQGGSLSQGGPSLRMGSSLTRLEEGPPGTAGYLAPERLHVQTGASLTPAADLFALGVIAFELSVNEPLFSGSQAQMLQQLIQAEQFIPVALTRLPPTLHGKLEAVIRRLLAPDPSARFAHIDDALRPLQDLQEQLKLKADLVGFVAPYLEPGPGERLEVRITGDQAELAQARSREGLEAEPGAVGLRWSSGPRLTHLTDQQLRALIPPARPKPLTLAGVAEDTRQRRRTVALQVLLGLSVLLLAVALLIGSQPYRIQVNTTPAEALVSLQPGCEGEWSAVQLSPALLRTSGPWPVCVRVQAPGHVRGQARVLQPSQPLQVSQLSLSLDREVCLKVGSRPVGVEVFIDNQLQGVTGIEDLRVCGLTPFEPYVVQMRYDSVRWDIREVVGKPGEELSVFQDFSVQVKTTASPFERCSSYFSAGELERAIAQCRVAVVESPLLTQKLDALILQGKAYATLDDVETACDLFGVALDRAVDARSLMLERRVIDVRTELDCEAVETARALADEARAQGTALPEEAQDGEEAPAGMAPAGTAPAGTAPAGTAPAGTAPAGRAPQVAPSAEVPIPPLPRLPSPPPQPNVPPSVSPGVPPASSAPAVPQGGKKP